MSATSLTNKKLQLAVAGWVVVAHLTAGAMSVFAHGEVIAVVPSVARHGETITVSGEGFDEGHPLRITLEGVRGTIELGEAVADAVGGFSVQFVIPEEAPVGTYKLKVTHGQESVSVDFAVMESSMEPSTEKQSGWSMAGQPAEVVFQRTTGETVTILVIAVVLAVSGTVLVLAGTERGLRVLRRK